MVVSVNPEDLVGQKFDKCLTDGIVKLGGGMGLGAVFSLLFVRRRWPILVGAGIGIGMAYNSCETSINDLFTDSQHSKEVKTTDPTTGEFTLKKTEK